MYVKEFLNLASQVPYFKIITPKRSFYISRNHSYINAIGQHEITNIDITTGGIMELTLKEEV